MIEPWEPPNGDEAGAATLLRLLAGHGEAELAVGHMIERYSTPYGA